MNDFTKEELYKICAIVTSHFCDIGIPTVDKELINKIESMIDNYCEHNKMSFDGDVYGYSCKNCEKQFTGQVIDADRHYKIICEQE
jgi:hypothetical protein